MYVGSILLRIISIFPYFLFSVFSRVWTLWAVIVVAPPAQQSVFLAFACTSWALVEVPRYLFYAFNLVDAVPYPLFWLRYRSVSQLVRV